MGGLSKRPILVTGMHRSGTTWVGRMLAASREAVYFHEPLNPDCSSALLHRTLETQYLYITEENEDDYLDAFRRLLAFPLGSRLLEPRRGQRLRRLGRLLQARATRARALLKDPFAVFSSPWFARRLEAEVVVVVRHPLAIVGSTKRLHWGFDTRSLLAQPLLLRDRLEPFRAELESPPTNIVGQAALLWRLVYGVVRDYAQELPQIRIVRHEDLSRDPAAEFERLYDELGLSFGARVRRAIERTTSPENPAETAVADPDAIELDSRANLESWTRRLNEEEIALVRRQTGDVARAFYPDS
jgi:sulfotransferase family protein